MRLIGTLALLLAFACGASRAQDLNGGWAVQQQGSLHRPGTALLTKKQGNRWGLALVQQVDGAIRRADLEATWEGSQLVVRAGGGGSGFVDSVGGGTSASAGAELGRYELSKGPMDLVRLTLAAGGDGALPRELHRPTDALGDALAPAEWEQAEEILWGYKDEFAVARIYAAAIKATLDEGVNHWLYCSSDAAEAELEYELGEAEVPLDRVRFSKKRFQTVWMRDFGPITLRAPDGKRIVGDMGYFSDRPKDDFVPAQYATARHWSRRDVESLKLEGGNFMSDGRGRLFTTSKSLQDNPSQSHVIDRLRELGGREVLFFERMPEPEGTGHIDMFAKLMDEDTVLVGRCETPKKFKDVLDRNAERFRQLGYEVIRLDMASGAKLMTYTNSLLVGKTVLVPTYKSPARDEAALEVYRQLGWKPVGIDARSVIAANGAIHCISMQIPR